MIVIPAVDIKGGRCVRLLRGKADAETVYSDDPVRMALRWREEGAQLLHVVDLDAAFSGEPVNMEIVKQIISTVEVPVQVGGGVRTEDVLREYIEAGAERVVIGSAAVENSDWLRGVAERWEGRVALAIDAREGMVAVRGWTEVSRKRATDLVNELRDCPLAAVIFTDISRDGTLEGPNFESIRKMAEVCPFPLIASGGVSSLDDIRRLAALPIEGTIVGKALYAGRFTLREALEAAEKAGGCDG